MLEHTREELAQSVMAAVPRLSDDDLKKVADYVTALSPPAAGPEEGVHPLFGSWQHLGEFSVTEEDIAEMRKEAWANIPREFPLAEDDGP